MSPSQRPQPCPPWGHPPHPPARSWPRSPLNGHIPPMVAVSPPWRSCLCPSCAGHVPSTPSMVYVVPPQTSHGGAPVPPPWWYPPPLPSAVCLPWGWRCLGWGGGDGCSPTLPSPPLRSARTGRARVAQGGCRGHGPPTAHPRHPDFGPGCWHGPSRLDTPVRGWGTDGRVSPPELGGQAGAMGGPRVNDCPPPPPLSPGRTGPLCARGRMRPPPRSHTKGRLW